MLSITYLEKNICKATCTPEFTVTLFTVAKIRKHPKCLSAGEWIKMWYMHTMGYYSAIKNNEIVPSAATWMDGSRESHTGGSKPDREGETSCDIPCVWNLR